MRVETRPIPEIRPAAAYLQVMPPTTTRPPPGGDAPAHARAFQQETARLLASFRELLAALVRSLPTPAANPSELQRATKLDMKLCWKVFRVISAPDGLSGAQYVPGPANMRDFLKTMGRLGAAESLLRQTAEAANAFERLVAEHAGNRRTFDSMVCGSAGIERDKVDLRQRKAAFQANSHLWGVQAEAMVMTMILRPSSSDPSRLDEIGLRGEFGVRRLRPSRLPLFEQIYATLDKRGEEYSAGRRRPLSGDGVGVGLVPEFCTQPLPEVTLREDPTGRTTATLMHPALGMKAAVDLAMGFALSPGAPRFRGEETQSWSIAYLTKPFRVAVIDLLIEEGTLPTDPVPFGFMSTKNSRMCPPVEVMTSGQLSDGEPVLRLGRGPEVLAIAEVPRYPELVAWSLRSEGWDPDRFEAWRLRVEYPVALSSVGLAYDMPAAPGVE